jgi:cytochrome c oxidase cbb3-type subunit 3
MMGVPARCNVRFEMRVGKNILIAVSALALTFTSCEREERRFRESPPASGPASPVRQSELRPGPPLPAAQTKSEYEENAYSMSEGKRLFEWYNCAGCHAHGGGAIGPPLMDEKWIYGSNAENIYATIVEGRPNGMPAFGDKVPDYQVWQLVAYVRALNGQVSKDAAPSRSDHMQGAPAEQSIKQEPLRTQKAERRQ